MNGIIQEARDADMNILIGGDMNGHIFEMDGCENENGRLLKEMVRKNSFEILNCIWPDMDKPTWSGNGVQYCLDYLLTNRECVNGISEACLMDKDEIVESDHCGITISIGLNVTRLRKKKKDRAYKRRLPENEWPAFSTRVNERMRVGNVAIDASCIGRGK